MLKKILPIIILVSLLVSCKNIPEPVVPSKIDISDIENLDMARREKPFMWDTFFIGSSYYPEWWDSFRWENDFKMMADLGFNAVRMGEFAWAAFETDEGTFDFAWMDKAVELAGRYNITVFLCTPTAALPPWLTKKYPDILTEEEFGRLNHIARRGYSTENPEMYSATRRIVTAMAKHYGNHPNIAGWQIDNEPGSPYHPSDKHTLEAFRIWLKQKYITLDSLNNAWNGMLWSLNYTSWDQIQIPLKAADGFEGGLNPGQVLDYRRFFSDSYVKFITFQANILREYTKDQPIFTNFPNNTAWSVNPFDANKALDLAAWDNYAQDPGVTDFHEQLYSGLNHDICRCAARNSHFIIAEQSTQPKPHGLPDKVRLQTYIDLAHGANGVIYFEWRSPLGGAEQGYPSVLDLDGTYNRCEPQFRQLCREMPKVWNHIKHSRIKSDIGFLFSYDNNWKDKFRTGEIDRYEWETARYYRGFKLLHQNFDVIRGSEDLSPYKMIIAPNLSVVSNEVAENLTSFVEKGGILIINKHSGTKDFHNRYRELTSPGVFSDIAGIKVTGELNVLNMNSYHGMQEGEKFKIVFNDDKRFEPLSTIEMIEPRNARVLATFKGGRYTEKPAVCMNNHGKGHVVYVGTDCRDYGFYDHLATILQKELNIKPIIKAPKEAEVVSRIDGIREFIFVMSLTEKPLVIKVNEPMLEIITEKILSGDVVLKGLDVMILERNRE